MRNAEFGMRNKGSLTREWKVESGIADADLQAETKQMRHYTQSLPKILDIDNPSRV